MSRVLPILFNTEMVWAILDGRKTVTRRVMKPQPLFYTGRKYIFADDECPKKWEDCDNIIDTYQYQPGDILYVRETWNLVYDTDDSDQIIEKTGRYVYYADDPMPFSHWVDTDTGEHKDRMPWRPSIHMPKEAARIWLKVTDVRVEQIKDMTLDDFISEGITLLPEAYNDPENAYQQAKWAFVELIKRIYPDCTEDSWFWVIEFERCGNPEKL